MKYTVQRMCSINDGGCDDNNNDNNEDIHSFGWRCAKGSSVFCKTILLPETGEVAPAGSSKKAGSRLLFFGSLGPDTWSYLNEPCLDFPQKQSLRQGRTLVQEDDPGSRREGIGGGINLRGHFEVIDIIVPLKSVQNTFKNYPLSRIVYSHPPLCRLRIVSKKLVNFLALPVTCL